MVAMIDIIEEINKIIEEKFPDDTVYINLQPKDFTRPCTVIELVDVERTDASRNTISVVASFAITCFTEIDGHYRSDLERLVERQHEIIDLFACGYLKVGDRCLHLSAGTGGAESAFSYIDIRLEYFDDRPTISEEYPIAESVATKIRTEEKDGTP